MESAYSPITMPNSETRLLESSIVEDTYQLYISLPWEYAESDKSYPVVYATDGAGAIFQLWDTANLLLLSQLLPPVIIVGIAYADSSLFWSSRIRDCFAFSSTEGMDGYMAFAGLESLNPGGAPKFLRFIREELQPLINAQYRTDPHDSAFVGISGGAMFGLYTLFHQPDTFTRYVLGSPPLHLGDRATLAYESHYAKNHDDLAANVFLSVGEREEVDDPFPAVEPSQKMVTHVKTLATALQKRNYPHLQLTGHVFAGETHLSVIPATYSRGLRTVFAS